MNKYIGFHADTHRDDDKYNKSPIIRTDDIPIGTYGWCFGAGYKDKTSRRDIGIDFSTANNLYKNGATVTVPSLKTLWLIKI